MLKRELTAKLKDLDIYDGMEIPTDLATPLFFEALNLALAYTPGEKSPFKRLYELAEYPLYSQVLKLGAFGQAPANTDHELIGVAVDVFNHDLETYEKGGMLRIKQIPQTEKGLSEYNSTHFNGTAVVKGIAQAVNIKPSEQLVVMGAYNNKS